MRFALVVLFAILSLPIAVSMCVPVKEASSVIERAKVPAFNGAVMALVLLDDYESRRQDAIETPTEADLAVMRQRTAQLVVARDSLAEVREWLEGNDKVDLRFQMKQAVDAMDLVVRSFKTSGHSLPSQVEDGLSAARLIL